MSAGWSRLDARYFRNDKNKGMGKDGRALDLAGICFSALVESHGHIGKHALAQITTDADVKPSTIKAVVAAGRWHELGTPCESEACPAHYPTSERDGWLIHDYYDYNRSAEEVSKQRNRWQKQKRAQRGLSTADEHADNADVHRGHGEMSTAESTPPTERNGTEESFTSSNNSPSARTRRQHVLDAFALIAWNQSRQNTNRVHHDRAAKKACAEMEDLDVYLREFPDTSASAIAAWLSGDKHSMAHATRITDNVVPIRGSA